MSSHRSVAGGPSTAKQQSQPVGDAYRSATVAIAGQDEWLPRTGAEVCGRAGTRGSFEPRVRATDGDARLLRRHCSCSNGRNAERWSLSRLSPSGSCPALGSCWSFPNWS